MLLPYTSKYRYYSIVEWYNLYLASAKLYLAKIFQNRTSSTRLNPSRNGNKSSKKSTHHAQRPPYLSAPAACSSNMFSRSVQVQNADFDCLQSVSHFLQYLF